MPDETELTRLAVLVAGRIAIFGDDQSRNRIAGIVADTLRPLAEELTRLRAEPTHAGKRLACSECKRLAERAEKLEAMLRKYQWRGHNGVCLACCQSELCGHRSDCELAALLAPAPPQVFPEAKPKPIELDADGLCLCEPSIRCPHWASGSTDRCTGEQLRAVGFETIQPARGEPIKSMPIWERRLHNVATGGAGYVGDIADALAELDRLRAEVESLRKVRDAIEAWICDDSGTGYRDRYAELQDALAACERKDGAK